MDANSGAVTVTIDTTTAVCHSFSAVNFTGTFVPTGTWDVYGSFNFGGGTWGFNANATVTFKATDAQTINNPNSKGSNLSLTFDGVGGSWNVVGALNNTSGNRFITLTNGSLTFPPDLTVDYGGFSSSNSNVRSLTLGLLLILESNATAWNTSTTTNMTLNKGSGTIRWLGNYGTTLTFAGGGLTYNNIDIRGIATDTWVFSGNNTFNDFKITTPPRTVQFTAGSTTTVQTFTVSGTGGNLNVLKSTSNGTAWNLAKAGGGTVSVNYVSLQDSAATPTTDWYAANSTNVSGNSGWTFSNIKNFTGLANPSTKTINGLALASTKTFNGLSLT